jgi:lysozyme
MTQEGINLIKKYEGLKLKAYLCPAGVPTIGYGNTYYPDGTKVKIGDVITLAEAERLLIAIIAPFEAAVLKMLKVPQTAQQISALTSLAYNIGITNLSKSTLLKKINSKTAGEEIKEQWLRWDKAGGKVLRGLTLRRGEEFLLYLKK